MANFNQMSFVVFDYLDLIDEKAAAALVAEAFGEKCDPKSLIMEWLSTPSYRKQAGQNAKHAYESLGQHLEAVVVHYLYDTAKEYIDRMNEGD